MGPLWGGDGEAPYQAEVGSDGCDARPQTDALIEGGIHEKLLGNGKWKTGGGMCRFALRRVQLSCSGIRFRNGTASKSWGCLRKGHTRAQDPLETLLGDFLPIPIAVEFCDSNTFSFKLSRAQY